MNTRQTIAVGFGLLLLTMAVAQLVSFGHFNHTMRSYLVAPGAGVRLLDPFILPFTFGFIVMHGLGAVGLLLMSSGNPLRPAFIKCGLGAMAIWFVLILSILPRDAPIGFVGFFGDKLRQPVNLLALLQSAFFVAWGVVAYRISQEEN